MGNDKISSTHGKIIHVRFRNSCCERGVYIIASRRNWRWVPTSDPGSFISSTCNDYYLTVSVHFDGTKPINEAMERIRSYYLQYLKNMAEITTNTLSVVMRRAV